MVLVIASAFSITSAQISSTRVELATVTADDTALFHVRVLRGQTIETATLTQGEQTLDVTPDPVQMPVTQWIVLDASSEMVNLEASVQAALQRFIRNNDNRTGVIIYTTDETILAPTDRIAQVENFIADYTATSGQPGCLTDALSELNTFERDLDRSWRVMVVTAGDFSRVTSCDVQDIPPLPAPIDIVAATDDLATELENIEAASGGDIFPANLRTIDARVSEVRTQWGQPTYALRVPLPADWDTDAPADLTVVLENGTEETTTVTFADYNVPAPPEPTAQPTEIVLATVAPRNTDTPAPTATEAAVGVLPPADGDDGTSPPPDGTPDDGGDNIALLLILGALLFIVGAVAFALGLARMGRNPALTSTQTSANFYDTLEDDDVENNVAATRIRERNIIGNDDDDIGVTQISDQQETTGSTTANVEDTAAVDYDAEDDLIITQVLTDDRFQKMMQQSRDEDEVVAWLRLEGAASGDYELTTRGVMIGRSQECDIQIKGDSAISRKHARLDVGDNGDVTVSRLSGVNPVVVGGVQIGNRHPLNPNDVIHLSDMTRLIFIARQDDDFDEEQTLI